MLKVTRILRRVAVLLAITVMFVAPAALADSSADMIKNCPDRNWCAYHRTTNKAWRYSPLDQINAQNVKLLRPVWIFQAGEGLMGLQSTPLVVDGMMYVATNPSTVWKLNAATGERIWAYTPELDEDVLSRTFFAHSRGLSIGDGRVYMGLIDGRVVALDEKTGKVLWEKQLVDSKKDTAGFSGAGTFVNSDLFVIGQNAGEYPVEGRIFALDPKTGDLKWTFYTTGRGDPKALATWSGDSWKYGGGGSWQPGTVDYDHNQILIGTSNPNPDYDFCGADCTDVNADAWRAGINLYTSSTLALDLGTGKLNWYFQEAPSDPYDYDAATGEYVLLDSNGRKLVLHPGKNGFNHVHDRKTGKPINVYPDTVTFNWTTGFNLETGEWENMLWPKAGEKTLVCPAIDGGHSWNAGTYSPQTGLFYRITNEWCMWLTVAPKGGSTMITAGSETRVTEPFAQAFMSAEWIGTHPPYDKAHGRLTARNPITGEIAWVKRYELIPHSALLSTGGGLLFNATYDGYAEALDAKTGEVLWRFNNGSGHNGGIVSYSVRGKQYIAVATGHGSYVGRAVVTLFEDKFVNYKESSAVVVFALP
ncbi:Quinohemoprotein alcohol dehydrogenase [Candidatus Entotheonellaceae bacterium PAL068K]